MTTLESVTALIIAIGNLAPLAAMITAHRAMFAKADTSTHRAERILRAAHRRWRN